MKNDPTKVEKEDIVIEVKKEKDRHINWNEVTYECY